MDNVSTTRRNEMYGGLSPEQRSSDRRHRIMEAATNLFSSREYESVTVADICAEAKVSKRYFYDHFADRSSLLLEIHEIHNDWLLRGISAMAPQTVASTEEYLRPILRQLVGMLHEHPERARIIYVDAPRMEARRRELLRSEAGFLNDLLQPILKELGDHRFYERTLLALVAGVTEVIIEWLSRDMADDPSELADHLTWLCNTVLTGCPHLTSRLTT